MKKTLPKDYTAQAVSDAMDWSPEPLLYGVMDAARLLCISTRKLWELTNRGEIESVKIGTARRYRRDALLQYIDKCTQPVVTK